MTIRSKNHELIQNTVGDQRQNLPDDVLKIKIVLDRLGYFDFSRKPEPHGYVTREMDAGIKRFQKDRNLRIDGWMKPQGETERALLKDLRKHVSDEIIKEELPAPTIPGTNIPDHGVPEGWTPPEGFTDKDRSRYEVDPGIEQQPPLFDRKMLMPYHENYFDFLKYFKRYSDI